MSPPDQGASLLLNKSLFLSKSVISAKKTAYENMAVHSIARAVRDASVAEHEEVEYDRMFRTYWDEAPKNLSEIPMGIGRYGLGDQLMKVFEVRVDSNCRKNRKLNVYGTVTLDNCLGVYDIYRRKRENHEVIRSRDVLTMMGPNVAVLSYDCTSIWLDLKDGRREICKGFVAWSRCWNFNLEDKPLTRKVIGNNGIGLVSFAIFSNAMLLHVELQHPKMEVFDLEIPRKIDTIKIYGRIDAFTTFNGEETFDSVPTTLFKKKHTNSVDVSAEGGLFPLSKSRLAFPHGGIKLQLKEHSASSGNSNIVLDSLMCTPQQFGNYKCKINWQQIWSY